jgi:hypothetical protein
LRVLCRIVFSSQHIYRLADSILNFPQNSPTFFTGMSKPQLLSQCLFLLLLVQICHVSHADVGTAAHYRPPYLRKSYWTQNLCLLTVIHKLSNKIPFFFSSLSCVLIIQPPRVSEAMRNNSRQATCSGRPGRGYGTTVPLAGDNIWCGA